MVNSHIHKHVCSCRELRANSPSGRTGFLAAGKASSRRQASEQRAHQSAGLILVPMPHYHLRANMSDITYAHNLVQVTFFPSFALNKEQMRENPWLPDR